MNRRPLPCQGSALPLSYAPKIAGLSKPQEKRTFSNSALSAYPASTACSALNCAGNCAGKNWSDIITRHFKITHQGSFFIYGDNGLCEIGTNGTSPGPTPRCQSRNTTFPLVQFRALGATAHDVQKLILVQGMTPVAIGAIIGLSASVALTKLISGLLFGVRTTDLATLIAVTLLLVIIALIAN